MRLECKGYHTYVYTTGIKDTLMMETTRTGVTTTMAGGTLPSVLSKGQELC